MGIGSIALVSLISFVGGLLFLISKQKLTRVLPYMVSLSIGALLGDSFLHLLPEAFEIAGSASLVGMSVLLASFSFLFWNMDYIGIIRMGKKNIHMIMGHILVR